MKTVSRTLPSLKSFLSGSSMMLITGLQAYSVFCHLSLAATLTSSVLLIILLLERTGAQRANHPGFTVLVWVCAGCYLAGYAAGRRLLGDVEVVAAHILFVILFASLAVESFFQFFLGEIRSWKTRANVMSWVMAAWLGVIIGLEPQEDLGSLVFTIILLLLMGCLLAWGTHEQIPKQNQINSIGCA